MTMVIICMSLALLLLSIFFSVSKLNKWDELSSSVFECGFSSYFKSRFSFSMHFFVIALIFLFLDLEICFLIPYFSENFSSFEKNLLVMVFLVSLLLGLLEEWKEGKIEWHF